MYTFRKLGDSDPDSDKTLRDVANSVTGSAIATMVGVVMMVAFNPWEPVFGLGAALAVGSLILLLLEVRVVLAPIRVPMEVLQNLEPEPELQPQPKLPTMQQKRKRFRLVVGNH